MNEKIIDINDIYKEIQDYIDPPPDLIEDLREEDVEEFYMKRDAYRKVYDKRVKELYTELRTLTPTQIGEVYTYGCRLLQRNVSGYMKQNFDVVYCSIMKDAVAQHHLHTAYLFLQVLADNQCKELDSVIDIALKIPSLQEQAMHIIRQLRLVKFKEAARNLMDSNDNYIRAAAKDTYKSLTT